MGVYRTAFDSIDQTESLAGNKVTVPIVAIGGVKGLGSKVGEMVGLVAHEVTVETPADCGHFVPEECPEAVIRRRSAHWRRGSRENAR